MLLLEQNRGDGLELTIAIFVIIFRLLYEKGAELFAEEQAQKNIAKKRNQ